MKINSKTIFIVGSITAIDFISDITIYSVGVSKSRGESFRFHLPALKEVAQIIAVGLVCGVAIDLATKLVEKTVETKQERKLQEIATKEFEDIQSGKRVNQKPEKVVWQPIRL